LNLAPRRSGLPLVDNIRRRQLPNIKTTTMRNISFPLFVGATLALAPLAHGDNLLDRLGFGKSESTNSPAAAGIGSTLTQDQMVGGFKEALAQGVQHAVTNLGKSDGFLKNLNVKIPMPESLQKVEKTLRTLRQDKLADEFVTTMNRAAEQAVPEAAAVLGDSVKQMSIADAKSILTGTNNAATQYFRRTSETNLYERFLPIVRKTTEQTGVTSAYKKMTAKVGGGLGGLGGLGGNIPGVEMPDLDSYVTHKTLDGLFLKIAEQEKQIRENPVARTTDLLQKVFGAVGK
jgi:hypothetical protein